MHHHTIQAQKTIRIGTWAMLASLVPHWTSQKIHRIIKLGCFRVFTYPTCFETHWCIFEFLPTAIYFFQNRSWCFAPHHPPAKVGEVKFRPGSWFDPAGLWKIPSVNGRYHGLPLMETSCEVSSTVDIIYIYIYSDIFWQMWSFLSLLTSHFDVHKFRRWSSTLGQGPT